MSVIMLGLGLQTLIVSMCLGAVPSEVDAAGEAVVRELVMQNFGGYGKAPWEVVCLTRREGFGEESEEAFLRRFEGYEPSVVSGDRCKADPSDPSRWLLEGTGEVGLEVWLREARILSAEELHVEAGASGGPMDFSLYECTLWRGETGWDVEDCVATIMT